MDLEVSTVLENGKFSLDNKKKTCPKNMVQILWNKIYGTAITSREINKPNFKQPVVSIHIASNDSNQCNIIFSFISKFFYKLYINISKIGHTNWRC